ACDEGLESTIVDLSRGRPVLLRPGTIMREGLAAVLGTAPADRDAEAPRASGTLTSHYAPRAPLELLEAAALEGRVREAAAAGTRVAVLAHSRPVPREAAFGRQVPGDARAYGHDLYASLRALDANGAGLIVVEAPPTGPDWEAVRDRLARAAAGADEEDET
ncbi:MAG TPA: Sua5 family C-terminal domain-containing protein, partial [Usitatibacteraceae bacterium]|nr:Sua5 family C-terminal domain-containing protein [Usitatibacteraceae bacterium]